MYLVQQISPFHCFAACLESYLYDLQINVAQTDIVNRCPSLFFKGTNKEGAFTNSNENLDQIANEFNIEIQSNPNNEVQILHETALFFFVQWENNPNDNHCIRFYKQENNFTYFMNPSNGKIESRESNVVNSWITKIVLIKR